MTLKRFVTTTAIGIILALPAASGFAQSPTAPAPTTAPGGTPPAASTAPRAAAPVAATPAATTPAARHMREQEMRASKLIGSSIHDASDQKIGSVTDLIVDRDGKVTEVVVGVGGFLGAGEKNVAVKMADLKRGKDNRFVLNTTKDALKQMAAYDLSEPAARSGSSTSR
jgi:sporulation protein YlmC with PRC-barrel domain